MRSRVHEALLKAKEDLPTTSPHEEETRKLAKAVLERDKAFQWQLALMPNQLNIMTVDGFLRRLTQLKPLSKGGLSFSTISDTPEVLYEDAARACIEHALIDETYQTHLLKLFLHLDNRREKLLLLFKKLLPYREQWLPLIYKAKQTTNDDFFRALSFMREREYEQFVKALPEHVFLSMQALAKKMALCDARRPSPFSVLLTWEESDTFERETALALFSLLMTQSGQFRKKFDHHTGLKRENVDPAIFKTLKEESEALFSELSNYPDFLKAMRELPFFPPRFFDAKEENILESLFALLPLLGAHLEMVFMKNGALDFTAVAHQALETLGSENEPTDLGLYLDSAISHLLIDEFQDTSMIQYRLILRLIDGWENDGAKTLFIVGDPMQSIYRFREAEVGLFLKAQNEGMGAIKLIPLKLILNFRSEKRLVEWVNDAFCTIFPKENDIARGAVSFHPSTPTKPESLVTHPVTAFWTENESEEASLILETILAEQKENPDVSIAILVRGRNLLAPIIKHLKEHHISFQGNDIEKLSNLMHIQDAFTLTKALIAPHDRIAWLALLRSPWCGLSLEDLHQLALHTAHQSILKGCLSEDVLKHLSEEGNLRIRFIANILEKAFLTRYQKPLAVLVLETMKALKLHLMMTAKEQIDLDRFLSLISTYEDQGTLPHIEQFEEALNALFATAEEKSSLNIMTIHKSKGLEFDVVILPGLGNRASPRDAPLFRFEETLEDPSHLLISPIRAQDEEKNPIYDFLARLDRRKDAEEEKRLLYVAVTRAKKKLYLFDSQEKPSEKSFRAHLSHQHFEEKKTAILENASFALPKKRLKLPLAYYLEPSFCEKPSFQKTTFSLKTTRASFFGTIAHEMLEWVCQHHPENVHELPWNFVQNRFKSLGFSEEEREEALSQLKKMMTDFFHHEMGSFIMAPHDKAQNEYPLMVMEHGKLKTYVIDRTFEQDGICWIIDFKTGLENETLFKEHQKQVNHYAHLMSFQTEKPLRCGVFYLKIGTFKYWDYSKQGETV